MNDVKSLWANWNWRFFLWWLREYLSVRVCLHLLGLLLNTEETSRKRWKLIDRPFKCVLACVILLSFRRTCIFVFFFFLILSTISLLIAVNLFWIDSIGWWFFSSSQIKISTFDWHWKNIFKSEKKILKPPSQTHSFLWSLFLLFKRYFLPSFKNIHAGLLSKALEGFLNYYTEICNTYKCMSFWWKLLLYNTKLIL